MSINDEFINVTHPDVTHPDVTQSNVTHPDVTHPDVTHPDVTQSNVTHPICDTILNIRMPGKLKNEIHRQAEELGMTTSSLAKAVLAQTFIK